MNFEADKSLMDAVRDIAPIIETDRAEAERERRLSKPVLDALRETGLLKMATPKSLEGLETDPITRALVVEEVGRLDSAAGWTLENPVDWAFFCARLPDEGAEEIYAKGGDVVIAAQFGRPLNTKSEAGGYRISGRAPFVSNCHDADWISVRLWWMPANPMVTRRCGWSIFAKNSAKSSTPGTSWKCAAPAATTSR